MANNKKTHYHARLQQAGEIFEAYSFNLPMIILAVVFIAIPVIGTLVTSLTRDVTFLPPEFIGIENYKRIFIDKKFWLSTGFTLSFTVVSVTLEIILGTVFALILNESIPGRGFLRVALLIPWAIPISISTRLWQLIYNYDFGILNYLIINCGISASPINWLGSTTGAFLSLLIADVWKTTPFSTIIILAGVTTIPNELYLQAKIDGSNFIQRFFKITLPLLRPVIIVVLLFRTIDAIRVFDVVYVLTGGGPGGSTTPLSLYAYKCYLTGDFGYGSAISVIVFVAVSSIAILYLILGKFKEMMK
jgi:multiple sugar transport system permease protein